jgi:hypothetical protein
MAPRPGPHVRCEAHKTPGQPVFELDGTPIVSQEVADLGPERGPLGQAQEPNPLKMPPPLDPARPATSNVDPNHPAEAPQEGQGGQLTDWETRYWRQYIPHAHEILAMHPALTLEDADTILRDQNE